MKKQRLLTTLLILMLSLSLVACSSKNSISNSSGSVTSSLDSNELSQEEKTSLQKLADDYANKVIGVQVGSVFDVMISQYIPEAKIEYYSSNADLALALNVGKISAYIADEPMARLLCGTYTNQYVVGVFEKCPYAYIYPKTGKTNIIKAQMNEYLAKIKEDGTLKEIDNIWFGEDESKKIVDTSNMNDTNGTLQLAIITAVGAPFVYVKDNSYVGYDVDIAVRFCKEYGYAINITDYNISGFFSSISGGLADFGASSICVTEERKETMDFSDPNYEGSIVLVTSNQTTSSFNVKDLYKSIITSFEKTFIRENRWMMFLDGFGITVLITLLSTIFGTIFGFVFFLIYRKQFKLFNKILDAISAFIQTTPIVVTLMIFYYLILVKTSLPGLTVSIVTFSLMFACTTVDLFKSANKTIDPEQSLAVKVLGYKDLEGFLRIILPQLLPHFFREYKGALVGLIKSTSIVSYVAVQDLTMITDIIRSRTFDAFFPLVVTAMIYFLFALLLTAIVNRIEIKIDPENRSKKKILKGVKTK